jgi:hypothetical protein
LVKCYNGILIIDKLEISCYYEEPIFVDMLDMIDYQIRYEMRLEQDSNLLLNSAAIPLPTPPNSAAGGDAPLADKHLKEQEFLKPRRPFAGARETWQGQPLSDPAGVQ